MTNHANIALENRRVPALHFILAVKIQKVGFCVALQQFLVLVIVVSFI
jgi:hypothetical protein